MNKVYYVGYYDVLRKGEKVRCYSLAAAKKMDFICDALNKLGCAVEIVSPAHITAPGIGYTASHPEEIAPNRWLALAPSWSASNKISRTLRILTAKFWLFFHLLRHCGKNSTVIVYHNYVVSLPVLLAQKIRRFHMLAEIEEQYSMVWKISPYQKWKENLFLRHCKKGSLVVSELLAQKLGIEDPLVSYGNYTPYTGEIPTKPTGGKIRLVYTGSIDKVKNSAYMALEVMPLLPDNYELKLSGPIPAGEESLFRRTMEEVNQKCGRTACEYLGVLDDAQYSDLLLNAHIALNLQQGGSFGEYLFPSKILTYLSYNLPVVTTPGESIVQSAVAGIVHFTKDFSLPEIAAAILGVDPSQPVSSREQLQKLGEDFTRKLRQRIRKN